MKNITESLCQLFHQWAGKEPEMVVELSPAGSERRYFRLTHGNLSAIGAWNPVVEENEAFFYFTGQFFGQGLHVPQIYGIDPDKEHYLLEDLGDVSLFSLLGKCTNGEIPVEIINIYRKSLSHLIRFQVDGHRGLDYSHCYPQPSFDRRSILFDLNYFKYYFLRLHLNFHESRLESDFATLTDFLLEADSDYFMYRDFQSRNIFIKNNEPYFIDYQGGGKGPLQYDVASLLFQVKADLPFRLREELLEGYLSGLLKIIPVDQADFKKRYDGFVLLRLLQVLGAYGFRGLIEKKPHFLASIPFALKNINWWLQNTRMEIEIPELKKALVALTELGKYQQTGGISGNDKLTVEIKSFSYRTGIPADLSGNGGGFVFDCRALPNPGREEKYRQFTGKDKVIIDYLKDDPEVLKFLTDAENLVSRSIVNYLARDFHNLSVSFGCTGGRHRSVYCTEMLAKRLKERFNEVNILVEHTIIDK